MTAQDIIQQAIDTDADGFRKALIDQAEMHDDAALQYSMHSRHERARQGARASCNACLAAYDHVGANDAAAIVTDCGTMVIALNVAGKLLGIERPTLTAAAVDWQEQHD